MMSPEAEAAHRVLDLCVSARVSGDLDQEALNWVFDAAFSLFRAEARESAKRQLEAERARRSKRRWSWLR